MKNLKLTLLLLFSCSSTLLIAQQDSIDYWLQQGIASYEAQDFQSALQQFRLAQAFTGDSRRVSPWMERTFQGYVDLLQQEKQGSELAGLAYKLRKTNPTHAARIAERALQLNPESYSASLQLNDIFDVKVPNFYTYQLQHGTGLTASAISPDGQLLASACYDDSVRLINVTDASVRPFALPEPAICLAFAPDGQTLAVGCADNRVYLYGLNGIRKQSHDSHLSDVSALAFSPDGSRVASVGWDGQLIIWNLESGGLIRKAAHEDIGSSVQFHPDGNTLATGGWDGFVHLWSVEGELLRSIKAHEATVAGLAFHPDGKQLFSAGWDEKINSWDVENGEFIREVAQEKSSIYSFAYHPQKKIFFTGSFSGTLQARDWDGEPLEEFYGHQRWVSSMGLDENGDLLVSSGTGGQLFLWNLNVFEKSLLPIEGGGSRALAVNADESLIATGHNNGLIQVWNAAGELVDTFAHHRDEVWTIEFVPNSDLIVSGGKDQVPVFRDLKTRERFRGPYPGSWIWDVVVTKDGQRAFFTGYDDLIYGFEIGDTTSFLTIDSDRANTYGIALSPDETRLVVSYYDHTAMIWTVTGDSLHLLEGHQGVVYDIAWSPDGKHLASAGAEGDVILWDSTGRQLQILSGHTERVATLTFSPDGQRLLTGSSDGSVRLWDIDGRLLQTFRGHSNTVYDVDFLSNGSIPISTSSDGSLRQWNTADQIFSGQAIPPLSTNEEIYYGLKDGTASPIRPIPEINNPISTIIQHNRQMQLNNGRNDFRIAGWNLSQKAYATPVIEEKLLLQEVAVAAIDSNYNILMALLEQYNLPLDRISSGVWNIRGFVYSNLALWRHLDGQHEQALGLARQAVDQAYPDPEVLNYLQLRLALSLALNEQMEEALTVLGTTDNTYASPGALRTFRDVTGIDLEDRSTTPTARELLAEEIAYLQELGCRHANLVPFQELLKN